MRTTLTLRQRKQPIGSVISALARQALDTAHHTNNLPSAAKRNGIPLLPIQPQGSAVHLELVNSLRED